MPAAPPAAIVIPVRRQVDSWLDRSVRSALHQTVPAEVIVVTAADTPPHTLALLARLQAQAPDRVCVIPEARPGFPAALNTGFAAARVARVGILLSDDWLDADAVEVCVGFDADIVSAGSAAWAADGETHLPAVSLLVTREGYAQCATLERRAAYVQPFLLFRRAAVVACGGVDETLGDTPGLDDFDLVWTLLEQGANVAVAGRSVYNYRDHPGERLTLGNREQMEATMGAILHKHGLAGEEHARVLASNARWFGRTMTEVQAGADAPVRA